MKQWLRADELTASIVVSYALLYGFVRPDLDSTNTQMQPDVYKRQIYCHYPTRCIRCGEGHHKGDCPRERTATATCANCREPHPASSRQCKHYHDALKRITKARKPDVYKRQG